LFKWNSFNALNVCVEVSVPTNSGLTSTPSAGIYSGTFSVAAFAV